MHALNNLPEPLRAASGQMLEEWLASVDVSDDIKADLPRVWAASEFVRLWCQRNAEAVACLQAHYVSGQLPQFSDYAADDFDAALRRYRNARMALIAWNEISERVSAQQTVEALSDLADECLRLCVEHHQPALLAKHGQPRDAQGHPVPFMLIALGKLGGRELNFSSDVDVIFAYGANGQTDGDRCLSNEQFFIRLGQKLIASMQNRSEHGFVFRVDLRLRPFGEQSPIAHAQDNLQDYYEAHGRGWERYAWIKARPVAGDLQAGAGLIEMLQPFVYRRYLDFGAIAALREMKAQIDEQVRKRGHEQDIKLGWGGIREVEFIAQVFQLVRGGAEPALRSHSLMEALDAIKDLHLYPAEKIEALRTAYWFLRRLENIWQAQRDEQSHVLPSKEAPRLALAAGMAYADWASLEADLQVHRAAVHAEFSALFAEPEEEVDERPWQLWWQAEADLPVRGASEELAEHLLSLRRRAQKRNSEDEQNILLELLAYLAALWDGQAGALRCVEVLESVLGRGNYLRLLHDNAVARREFVALCRQSPWIAQEMKQFPAVLSELLDPQRLYAPDERSHLQHVLKEHLAALPEKDVEARLDVLRRTRHACALRIAAADVSAALPIMRVSDRLSELAEEILQAALDEAVRQMQQRFPEWQQADFTIIAYGKLGGLELSYSSDLDLVFVYQQSGQELPLDPQVFYTRLAQKLIHCLATPTAAGMAYEIDTRLRPSGASGLLVTSLDALRRYQQDKAWTWEHQALIRARPVAGSASLRQGFDELRLSILSQSREPDALYAEVQEMREKMRQELAPKDGSFHPKQSPGGMVDIEFFTQFAVLACANRWPQVARYTDVMRILESLETADLLPAQEAGILADAYRQLRAAVHEKFLRGEMGQADELSALAAQVQTHLQSAYAAVRAAL